MIYLQRLGGWKYLRGSRFIWKPQGFLQALKDKGSYQNPALLILSYLQDQQKERWLPISLSFDTDCDCGTLILPTPPVQMLCTLTDSSNIVACHYMGGIWGGTIQLSITFTFLHMHSSFHAYI